MKVIIQKFGGTSVSTPQARQEAVAKVQEALDAGDRPGVVVSAMGRYGAPYAASLRPKEGIIGCGIATC